MTSRLTRGLLFVPGHFFFYPWKPALLLLHSCEYSSAFRNFAAQHDDRANIAMHVAALALQLTGNFGLLDQLGAVTGLPWSAVSLAGWTMVVLWSGAWRSSKILSIAACGMGWYGAGWAALHPVRIEIAMVSLFFTLMALLSTRVIPTSPPPRVTTEAVTYGLMLYAMYAADALLRGMLLASSAQASPFWVGVGASIVVALCSQIPGQFWWPRTVLVMAVLRAAALLTHQPGFLMWGLGFTGQLLQGFAHEVAAQTSTIQKLELVQTESDRISYECAHVIFFPCLVFDVLLGRSPAINAGGMWSKTQETNHS
eukprot:TRINITY_DN20754_c0_g1_i1.p1 TRINITY_DN20754_c0_g1~~TRINITY_DN20754_c0_g1_i1.p1  ORF type:complete len:312 (+),score=41.62 TRINITY_DN20754_c0_g1_i1:220-1155(+)